MTSKPASDETVNHTDDLAGRFPFGIKTLKDCDKKSYTVTDAQRLGFSFPNRCLKTDRQPTGSLCDKDQQFHDLRLPLHGGSHHPDWKRSKRSSLPANQARQTIYSSLSFTIYYQIIDIICVHYANN